MNDPSGSGRCSQLAVQRPAQRGETLDAGEPSLRRQDRNGSRTTASADPAPNQSAAARASIRVGMEAAGGRLWGCEPCPETDTQTPTCPG